MEHNTVIKGSSDIPLSGVALARKALEDSSRLRKARLAAEAIAPEVEAKAND